MAQAVEANVFAKDQARMQAQPAHPKKPVLRQRHGRFRGHRAPVGSICAASTKSACGTLRSGLRRRVVFSRAIKFSGTLERARKLRWEVAKLVGPRSLAARKGTRGAFDTPRRSAAK